MDKPQRPCVYALYIPGGGVFGLMPALMLEYLNSLTDIPTAKAFPVKEAVSTGAIIVTGLDIPDEKGNPKYTESQAVDMFIKSAPEFFPSMPGRAKRLAIFNTLSHIQRRMDPLHSSKLLITGVIRQIYDIKRISKTSEQPLSDEDIAVLNDIKKRVRKRWITGRDIRFVSKQTKRISEGTTNKDIQDRLKIINDYTVNRHTNSGLKGLFNRACFCAVSTVRQMNSHDIHFDPSIPQQTFRNYFGEVRISDLISSVYISTYNLRDEEKMTFYSRKKDLFNFAADAPRTQSHLMPKAWDAVMASISSQLAFPAHKMESGHLTEDWAPIHNPQKSIDHIIENLPENVDFKLVIMGTGDNKTPYYDDHGTIGNLLGGRTLSDMTKYTNSDFKRKLIKRFGADCVIEFNPRLAPRTMEEHASFPDKDMTNASAEQLERITRRTKDYMAKEDTNAQFKKLAIDIVENMHRLGQVSFEHVQQTRERCGLARVANDNEFSPAGIGRWIKGLVANPPKFSLF